MEVALAAVETLAVLVLVAVTVWYARQTRRQADAAAQALERMRDQADLMAKAALLTAYVHQDSKGLPGRETASKLSALVKELEARS